MEDHHGGPPEHRLTGATGHLDLESGAVESGRKELAHSGGVVDDQHPGLVVDQMGTMAGDQTQEVGVEYRQHLSATQLGGSLDGPAALDDRAQVLHGHPASIDYLAHGHRHQPGPRVDYQQFGIVLDVIIANGEGKRQNRHGDTFERHLAAI